MRRFDRRRLSPSRTVGAAAVVLGTALLMLAMFLSSSLQSAVYDLPPSSASEGLAAAVDTWHGWMEELGAAGLSQAVVDAVDAVHQARFDE